MSFCFEKVHEQPEKFKRRPKPKLSKTSRKKARTATPPLLKATKKELEEDELHKRERKQTRRKLASEESDISSEDESGTYMENYTFSSENIG